MPLVTLTPPQPPSFPFEDEREPRVLRAKFGDGIGLRVGDGANIMPQILGLQWENLTLTESATLLAFFEARQGSEAFYWTPPNGTQAKYICSRWKKSKTDGNAVTVTASFEQVFDPGA